MPEVTNFKWSYLDDSQIRLSWNKPEISGLIEHYKLYTTTNPNNYGIATSISGDYTSYDLSVQYTFNTIYYLKLTYTSNLVESDGMTIVYYRSYYDVTTFGSNIYPSGIAFDSSGNLYFTDTANRRIKKIGTDGVVAVFAGSDISGNTDGTGVAATFNMPYSIAVDSSGEFLYIGDIGNNNIRKIVISTQLVTTIDISGSSPQGLVYDGNGYLYVTTSQQILKILCSQGSYSVYSGINNTSGNTNGAIANNATYNSPEGIVIDSFGNIFIADTSNRVIRKIDTANSTVANFAGSGSNYSIDGIGLAASFKAPKGLSIDSSGNLYVTDDNLVRKITPVGAVSTLAGGSNSNNINGVGASVNFSPNAVAVNSSGNIFVADLTNTSIYKITSYIFYPKVTNFGVSTPSEMGFYELKLLWNPPMINPEDYLLYVSSNGGSTFNTPINITPGISGEVMIYVLEDLEFATSYTLKISSVFESGEASSVTIVASTKDIPYLMWDLSPLIYSSITLSWIGPPQSVTYPHKYKLYMGTNPNTYDSPVVDISGGIFDYDISGLIIGQIYYFKIVYKPDTVGSEESIGVTTEVNNKSTHDVSIYVGNQANLKPQGLVFDNSGNMYITDVSGNCIWKKTPSGDLKVFAGKINDAGSADGTGTAAQFNMPLGITIDSSGNLYVADHGNNKIRKITPGGVVSTIVLTNLDISGACGIDLDSSGNLYISEYDNHVIKKLDLSGNVTLFAGITNTSGDNDGLTTNATFNTPSGIAVDSSGNVYVADSGNKKIRKVTPTGEVSTFYEGGIYDFIPRNTQYISDVSAIYISFFGIAIDSEGNLITTDPVNLIINKITPSGVLTHIAYAGSEGLGLLKYDSLIEKDPGIGLYGIDIDSSGNIYVANNNDNPISRQVVKITNYNNFDPHVSNFQSSDIGFDNVTLGWASPTTQPDSYVIIVLYSSTKDYVSRQDISGSSISDTVNGLSSGTEYEFIIYSKYNDNSISSGVRLLVTTKYDVQNVRYTTSTELGEQVIWVNPTDLEPSEIYTYKVYAGTNKATYDVSGSGVDVSGFSYDLTQQFPNGILPNETLYMKVCIVLNDVTSPGTKTVYYKSIFDVSRIDEYTSYITQFAFDSNDNLYAVSQTLSCVYKKTPDGSFEVFAGSNESGGYQDGSGDLARFDSPTGLTIDSNDNIYICDNGNKRIRKITPNGIVTTYAGNDTATIVDGNGTNASFDNLTTGGIAVDSNNNLYVVDYPIIRKIDSSRNVSTFVHKRKYLDFSNDVASSEYLADPLRLACDSKGFLYVTDSSSKVIQKIDPRGDVIRFVGGRQFNGVRNFVDGFGTDTYFGSPSHITISRAGICYISDAGSYTIRQINSDGLVRTLAGNGEQALSGTGGVDGTGENARFISPQSIAFDSKGDLYVLDIGKIRKITYPFNVDTQFFDTGYWTNLLEKQMMLPEPRAVFSPPLNAHYLNLPSPIATYFFDSSSEIYFLPTNRDLSDNIIVELSTLDLVPSNSFVTLPISNIDDKMYITDTPPIEITLKSGDNGKYLSVTQGYVINDTPVLSGETFDIGTYIFRFIFSPSYAIGQLINTATTTFPSTTVCFLAGTKVETDQGLIDIDKISTKKNTINGRKIVAIVATNAPSTRLYIIRKSLLAYNIPNKETIITGWHKILYNGDMIIAGKIPGSIEIKYNGEITYNVLMENHETMRVNNMTVETLYPGHPVAESYIAFKKGRHKGNLGCLN